MARFLRFARPCPRQGDAQKIIDRLEVLGTEPARMVAKVIRNCATDDPCRSLACPMCRHWAQCAFVGAVAGVWNPTAANTTLTLIPLDGVLDYDALDDFDLLAFKRRHAVALKRALPSGTMAVGAVEFSLNTFKNADPYWQAHLHVIVEGDIDDAVEASIRARYVCAPEVGIHRPVMIKVARSSDLARAMEYPLKDAGRRSSYIAAPKPQRNRKPYKANKYQPLNSRQACLFALMQGDYKVLEPLLLIGVKRVRTNDSHLIRLIRTLG